MENLLFLGVPILKHIRVGQPAHKAVIYIFTACLIIGLALRIEIITPKGKAQSIMTGESI